MHDEQPQYHQCELCGDRNETVHLETYSFTARTRSSLVQLEDCSDHEEDKTRNARDYSDHMEHSPAITKVLPVARKR